MLFILNKTEIVFSVCFLNYPCNKKYPENKSSPNALKIKYDSFLEYLRISGTENTAGEQAPGHEGGGRALPPWARPLPHGPMVAPLHLF